MSKNTMVDLVIELEKMSNTSLRTEFIQLAKRGDFHDFRSEVAGPKIYFCRCVAHAKTSKELTKEDMEILERLEEEIKNGDYDENLTRGDRVEMAKDLNQDKTMSDRDKKFFANGMNIKFRKTVFGTYHFYVEGK